MSSSLEKVKSIFKSPGIAAVLRWSGCVHLKVVLICMITVLATVCSLCFTLATKGLVNGAVSSKSDQLVRYALMLVGIILMQHLLANVRSWLRIHASAELQKMLVHEILSKEYGGLKGYHSGELVNRVFSDMSVIKNGIMSILPSLIGIVVSFVGAAGILIAMDWHFVILMLAGGILGLALVILFRGPMKARHKRMQEAEEEGEVLHSFDEIVLDDITFKYDDGIEEVLQHVNWTIKRGDFMALTGISGGGKTSLFQLLLGIYKPTKGRMLFRAGGLEVPASRGTRALFAYVPQGNTLFSGSLRDNLTMFTDEATSALDEKTEAKLLKNISGMRDKTCIIVTHRRAALDICDYTLHIEEGVMSRKE